MLASSQGGWHMKGESVWFLDNSLILHIVNHGKVTFFDIVLSFFRNLP